MTKYIGVIGDTHFGASLGLGKIDPTTQLNTRLLDYEATFNKNIDYFVDNGVGLVVLTGDIFETRHPTSTQHKIFSGCLKRALDKGLEFIIVVGNHDQQRDVSTNTIDLYKTLQLKGVNIFEDFGTFKYEDTNLFLMPYRDRKSFGVNTNQEAIDILNTKLNDLGFDKADNKVVVGHYMFEGTTSYSKSENFSMTEIYLTQNMFSDCSTVVMGHIHKGEVICKSPKIIYSGSMERNTYGEKDYDKGVVLIDTEDYSKSKFVKTEVRDLYDIKLDYSDSLILKGETMKQLLADIDNFCVKNDVSRSIARVSAKIDEIDLYSVSQNAIKNYLYQKGVAFCSGVSISSFMRSVKKSEIVELSDSKKILSAYVKDLDETDKIKKDMVEYANMIINDIDGGQGDSSKVDLK